jgi:hypothetical protein
MRRFSERSGDHHFFDQLEGLLVLVCEERVEVINLYEWSNQESRLSYRWKSGMRIFSRTCLTVGQVILFQFRRVNGGMVKLRKIRVHGEEWFEPVDGVSLFQLE